MLLMSCDSCGVVLDKDKLPFSKDVFDETGSLDESKAEYFGERYVRFVACPVCGSHIYQDEDSTEV